MTRLRTATNILESRGTFKKNPQRKRLNEPKPAGNLETPPGHLTAAETALWKHLVEIVPAGVLTRSDEAITELTVTLWAKVRDGTARAADRVELRRCLSLIGLTPSDRSRVSVPPENPVNEFDDL